MPPTIALGTATASLMPGSSSPYQHAQIRSLGAKCRIQGALNGKGWEHSTNPITDKLMAWIAALPHTSPSMAGSGTMYAPCQIRGDGEGTRVQIAGPEFNRAWGAEFVLPGWYAPGCKPTGEAPAPKPDPMPDPTPDEIAGAIAALDAFDPHNPGGWKQFGSDPIALAKLLSEGMHDAVCGTCERIWGEHNGWACP